MGLPFLISVSGSWRSHFTPLEAIRERAGMPEVFPYALRQSSLVRGLRKGLPIQQVAKLHSTPK
jgi:hypothetical protein